MANPPESIEIADIATIETAELIVESCGADDGVHDIDEESFIILFFQLYVCDQMTWLKEPSQLRKTTILTCM